MKITKLVAITVLLIMTVIGTKLSRAGLWQKFKAKVEAGAEQVAQTAKRVEQRVVHDVESLAEKTKQAATVGAQVAKAKLQDLQEKAEDLASQLSSKVMGVLRTQYNKDNPYKHTPAVATATTNIDPNERNIVQKRALAAQRVLEAFLGTQLTQQTMPRIGLAASGGGYRAMLFTLGAFRGLEKIELDALLHASTLSGSTWFYGPYLHMNLSLEAFKQQLQPKTQNTIGPKGKQMLPPPMGKQFKNLLRVLEHKLLFEQPISSVDLWGGIIVNRLLDEENRQFVRMTDLQDKINDGSKPYPLFTAVHPLGNLEHEWATVTPYDVTIANVSIPTFAFGRKFRDGNSHRFSASDEGQYGPETTLGFDLGVFGSAYTFSLEELLNMIQRDETLDPKERIIKETILKKLTGDSLPIQLGNRRFFPAKVNNFAHGVAEGPIREKTELTLTDGALAFNIPLPPLFHPERALDVMFVIDASGNIETGDELRKFVEYAQKKGLKLPPIDINEAKTKPVSIFSNQEDPSVPTIIYVSIIKDPDLPTVANNELLKTFDPATCIKKESCVTVNFNYTPTEFEQVIQLAEANIVGNKERIKEALEHVVAKKRRVNP